MEKEDRIMELEKYIRDKEHDLQYFKERNEFYEGYVILIREMKRCYKELSGRDYQK